MSTPAAPKSSAPCHDHRLAEEQHLHEDPTDHGHGHDAHLAPKSSSAPAELTAASAQAIFLIQRMACPTEERLIRGRLEGMEGVEGLPVRYIDKGVCE